MRRYHAYTPASTSITQSLSEESERWDEALARRQEREEEASEEPEAGTRFSLRTPAGTLSYKPNDCSNYTDFLRVVFEMSLAFNSGEVDPTFRKIITKALKAYESGEDFADFDEEDDEEMDFVAASLELAKEEERKFDEAQKFVTNLPQTDKLSLRILDADGNYSRLDSLLSKNTDLPPNQIHAAIHNGQSFTVPYEKGTALYIQMRMFGVVLNIKPVDSDASKKVVKKAAAKTQAGKSKKTAAGKASAKGKNNATGTPTGSEKLKPEVGIIQP